jgi:hypothetical protein
MASLVRHHPCFSGDVLSQYRHDGRGLKVVNDNRPRFARRVIHKAQHLHLVVIGALLGLAGFATYESLVRFHYATTAADQSKFPHSQILANAMHHQPSALLADTKHAVHLMRTHALLGRAK